MAQAGIPYVLTGPDGTRVVFNDRADLDFVGFLDGENGVTGLEGTDVRENAEDLVGADGGTHGDFYEGRRPITLQGLIWPDPDSASVNNREARIKRASRALREDCILSWQQDGREATQLSLRRQGRPSITGRRPKAFQLALVAADYRIVGTNIQSAAIPASGSGSGSGFTFPLGFDFDFGSDPLGAVGQADLENTGDAPASPLFRIDGPITNPTILNNTTGERIDLTFTLGAGEFLLVDAADRSIKLGGTVDRYSAFNFDTSDWWELQPGSNDVRILAASYSAPAALTVYWRNSFI
jgi:hypothetical protein